MTRARQIQASPNDFPHRGFSNPASTALLVIDMQNDFCAHGGYVERQGYSLASLQAPIARIQSVVQACRCKGIPVLFTRQGYRADLADLTPYKAWRGRARASGSTERSPFDDYLRRDLPGFEIIPELKPLATEPVIDKTANSAFCYTDLEPILRARQIDSLMLCGVTTDVCVHSTLRDADDRGFECLLIEDCCASTEERFHRYAVEMMQAEGGVFGCVAFAASVIQALSGL